MVFENIGDQKDALWFPIRLVIRTTCFGFREKKVKNTENAVEETALIHIMTFSYLAVINGALCIFKHLLTF